LLYKGKNCKTGSNRMKRGGSWNNDANNSTVANRNNNNPNNRNNNIGFRVSNTFLERVLFKTPEMGKLKQKSSEKVQVFSCSLFRTPYKPNFVCV